MRIKVKKLIVNADDFGISRDATDAIIDCHRDGIVTSTTLMSNMPSAEYAALKARAFPKLSVGLHLNLIEGKPVAAPDKVDSLVDSEGNFWDGSKLLKKLQYNRKVEEQIYRELEAQLLRALDLGVKISHFDSHRWAQKNPMVRRAIIKLHKLYGVPAVRTEKGLYWTHPQAKFYFKLKKTLLNIKKFRRMSGRMLTHLIMRKNGLITPDRTITLGHLIPQPKDPKERFIQCLKSLPNGISEMFLHPGYSNSGGAGKIGNPDVQIACDEDVISCIKECDIKLISFNELLNSAET